MNSLTQYLNTDLDLRSAEELTALATEFGSRGLWQVHRTQEEDGSWFAIFETADSYAEPNQSIAKMLDVIEALAREDAHRQAMRCYVRLGQRAQALRHYRLCGQALAAEFDAQPEPATVGLPAGCSICRTTMRGRWAVKSNGASATSASPCSGTATPTIGAGVRLAAATTPKASTSSCPMITTDLVRISGGSVTSAG